jgi:hypothetical protein
MGTLSAWLQHNSYQQLYKYSSDYNNIPIYVVLGILSTRLDKIGKAIAPLSNSYNQKFSNNTYNQFFFTQHLFGLLGVYFYGFFFFKYAKNCRTY